MDLQTHASTALCEPVVICVVQNGSQRTERNHPQLPMAPEEIARDAVVCVQARASILHLHVRIRFENNLHLSDGTLTHGTSNLESIVQELAHCAGRGTASMAHARHVYGLSH